MPPSRKEANGYCKSNRDAMDGSTNGMKHAAIVSCKNLKQLCNTINPGDDPWEARYYKLNLQNLKTKRQPTIEFRQHSGTANYNKIEAWVRFCVAFVNQSANQPRPSALQPDENAFDALFQGLLKDLALREYYVQRRIQLRTEPEKDFAADSAENNNNNKMSRSSCCDGCANGGACAMPNRS